MARANSKDPEIQQRLNSVITRIRWWDWVVWSGKSSVNTLTGQTNWTYKTLNDYWTVTSVVVGHDVIVLDADGKIERLTLKDGNVIWKANAPETPESVKGTRALCATSQQCFTISATNIRAYNLTSGKEVWTATLNEDGCEYPTVLAAEDGLFVYDRKKCNYYELSNGKKRWDIGGGCFQASQLAGGDILILSDKGLSRLRPSDGKVLWTVRPVDSPDRMSLMVANPYVIIGGWTPELGHIEVFDQDSGSKLFGTVGCLAAAAVGSAHTLFLAKGNGFFQGGDLLALNPVGWNAEWSCKYEMDGIDLLIEDSRLFLCEYDSMACDVGLKCLKLNGEIAWKAKPTGISVSHSEYEQRSHLLRQNGNVVLVSNQSSGEFIETFNAQSGESVTKWHCYFNGK